MPAALSSDHVAPLIKIVRFCPCGQTPLSKLLELGCVDRKTCTDPIPSCGKTCGKPLPCGSHDFIHTCENLCHEGECGPCSRTSNVSCRCGFKTKEVPCAIIQNEEDITFICDKRCNKKRQCGRHKCSDICCVDKEHKCSLICGHKLNCGLHRCDQPCHRGNCQNCWQTSRLFSFLISSGAGVLCPVEGSVKYCSAQALGLSDLSRRLRTAVLCSALSRADKVRRSRSVKTRGHDRMKMRSVGPGPPLGFDELTCYCGESIIYPPVPCGTRPPECKNSCTRQHECDHPVFHSCHSEDKCPPCTYLTQKWCMGKHELRNNIPCHLTDISCGLRCNQLLKCAMHKCKRICHKGECLIAEDCKQPCIVPRPDCGHPCLAACHPSQPCPPSMCSAMVDLQCDCGRRKESVVCATASSAYQRIAAISMATKLTEMQLGDSVDIGKLVTKKEIKQTRLQCDEECLALERNRRLAEALNITENSDPFNTRSGFKFSDSLKDDARKDLKFVSDIEKEVKALVEAVNKGRQSTPAPEPRQEDKKWTSYEARRRRTQAATPIGRKTNWDRPWGKQTKKSHCFPPMNRDHRKVIHDLAEVYGVESVSYDNEPKRNVVITAIK
ncbi:unnamed protein product [Ranitomeya imitator]|uniref:R3H domain-containing protein n=1 Tax=Ranitomeya imitator TaxID=111125 RepID=A0ABN9MDI3_9NEOB|nr:unnamed protein product [Ranitomeya imitator]